MVSFGEVHVYLQLSCRGLFGGKKTNPWLETPELQKVFLSGAR
jgi:hypothetical protein